MKTLIICLLFGVCFGQLFDVYVSPDGTDNGTCGRTQSTPCQTMAGALQVVPERKVPVINLQPGEYTGPNNINQTYPVGTIIQGYNGIHSEYETIFDCTGGTDTVFYFPSTASVYNIVMKNCAYGVVFETPNPEDFLKVKHVNSYTCGTAFHISGGRFNISYTNVNTSSIGIHIENAYENCLIYSYSAFNVLQSILLESSANVQFLSITIVVLESSGGMLLHGNPDTYISINFAQFDMITSTTCIEVTCGKFLIRNSLFNNANTKGISFTGDEQSSFTVQSSQFFEISVGIEYAGDGIFEISGPKFYNISSSPVVIHSGTKGEIYNIWVYNAPNPTVIDTPTPIYLNITDCYFSNSSGIVANLVKESVVYLISPVFQHTNGRVLDARGGFWYIDEAYVSQTGIVQGNGGAFYLQNSANFDIATFLFYNLVVVEATATGYGGAIYLDGSKLAMHYGYLQSNVAKQGGAIYGVDFVEVVIVDVLFENNVATQMGGALAFDNSDTSNANVSLVNTQFTDNYAREGSVVYCCFPTGSCGVTLDIVNGISLSGNVNFIPGGEDIDCETNGYYFTHSEG